MGECFVTKFINPLPNKPWFLHVCSTSLLKTLWEKEKLLVTSNFSFSHSVLHRFGELSAIFIKLGIVCSTSLLKTLWEKEKLLVTNNFCVSHSVLYRFGELSAIFIKLGIVVCKLFQFRRVQKSLLGKGLTLWPTTIF